MYCFPDSGTVLNAKLLKEAKNKLTIKLQFVDRAACYPVHLAIVLNWSKGSVQQFNVYLLVLSTN